MRRRRVAAAGAAGAYAVHKHRENQEEEEQEPVQTRSEQDAPTDQAGGSTVDPVAQLTELASLRDSGALTDAEFDAEKQKIIGA